ncbi:MAG: TlyA family RNA methyltransferase [Cyanobacteria bacterium NC_groundwater_1444_Ag_S-0.65um_54_12]|nr:TlyA family RNA methyltransferase [Cyanobacteria bacterium NC_groundwater_1444_Ag_S-0.65um_54_12]
MRLDLWLVENGYFASRQAAQGAIMAGQVSCAGHTLTKPGVQAPAGGQVAVKRPAVSYVSRGGIKLAYALDNWPIAVEGRIALDIGASTGGFTDVLLRRGVRLVYAIDVGYGQLAWSLRQDSRVVVKERTNARYLTRQILYGAEPIASLAVIDVAFISLTKILPAASSLLAAEDAVTVHQGDSFERVEIIALIKPQFEAGRAEVGRKGVVRSPEVRLQVVDKICQSARELGFTVQGVVTSPIYGPQGNVEFLAWFSR